MDWSLCAVCQMETSDELVYPNKGQRFPAYEVFQNFFINVQEFKSLQALPCQILFDEECTANTFVAKNACLHKGCYQ